MTISIEISRTTKVGDGSTVAFPVADGGSGIYFADTSELGVSLRSGSTVTAQALGTHYTVSGAGSAAGEITFLTAPADGVYIDIVRSTPKTQTLNLTAGGSFNPASVMGALDKLTRIAQDFQSLRLSDHYRGAWVTSTDYAEADIVTRGGTTYYATEEHTSAAGTEPGVGASWDDVWSVLAAGGEDGTSLNWTGPWQTSTGYVASVDGVSSLGSSYICTVSHTSGASTEPGVGASWADVWDVLAEKGGSGAGTGDMLAANNLSDLANKPAAVANLGAAAASHAHAASAIVSGTLAHERGGLEADVSAYSGLVKIASGTTSAVAAPSGTVVGTTDTQTLTNKTLTAPVINVGSDAEGDVYYRSSGGVFTRLPKGTSGHVLTQGASVPSWVAPAAAGWTLGTEQATTSGTSINWTGIPSGTTTIILSLVGVGVTGFEFDVQIGDAGGLETTGYAGTGVSVIDPATTGTVISTSGFELSDAAGVLTGSLVLSRVDSGGLKWVASWAFQSGNEVFVGGGGKTLSAELDRISLVRQSTDTFNAGSANIQYI